MTTQTQKTAPIAPNAQEMPAHILAILAGNYSLQNTTLNAPETKAQNTKQARIKEMQKQYAGISLTGDIIETKSATMRAIDECEEIETHDINAGDNSLISID